ncbi:aminotransferase class V-fold PLP-dependent enzyme [Streptomyces californicus]|uniref:aminotransferase class V-fold PLP-dependent enzyme n=1 Tax=Streptomyces californicus TaxID=67351 RepID=UPI003789FC8B
MYGNPSSPHALGRTAAKALRTARRQVTDLIGAKNELEVVFTSGATEANHLAIVGAALAADLITRTAHTLIPATADASSCCCQAAVVSGQTQV